MMCVWLRGKTAWMSHGLTLPNCEYCWHETKDQRAASWSCCSSCELSHRSVHPTLKRDRASVRVIKQRAERRPVHHLTFRPRIRQPREVRESEVQVNHLGEHRRDSPDRRGVAGGADEERHASRRLKQAHLGPQIVFPKLPALLSTHAYYLSQSELLVV